jgi:hypothetical protein
MYPYKASAGEKYLLRPSNIRKFSYVYLLPKEIKIRDDNEEGTRAIPKSTSDWLVKRNALS